MADLAGSPATRIRLYRNGDSSFTGRDVIVNPRQVRSFNALLDIATKSTGSDSAVRQIYTPMGRHRVNNLMALNHNGTYVAVGREGFKKAEYGKSLPKQARKTDGLRLPPIHKPRNLPNSGRRLEVYEGEKQQLKRIHIYLNGDCITPPVTVLLKRKFQKDMESVFKCIQESRLNLARPIGRLYTIDGREVVEPKQLQSEGKYVAVERCSWYKSIEYSGYVYCPHYFPPIINSMSGAVYGSALTPTKLQARRKNRSKKVLNEFSDRSSPFVRPHRAGPNLEEQERAYTLSSRSAENDGTIDSGVDFESKDASGGNDTVANSNEERKEAGRYEDDFELDTSTESEGVENGGEQLTNDLMNKKGAKDTSTRNDPSRLSNAAFARASVERNGPKEQGYGEQLTNHLKNKKEKYTPTRNYPSRSSKASLTRALVEDKSKNTSVQQSPMKGNADQGSAVIKDQRQDGNPTQERNTESSIKTQGKSSGNIVVKSLLKKTTERFVNSSGGESDEESGGQDVKLINVEGSDERIYYLV